MNLVFRVDAGMHTGHGHVMRCLTLAGAMQQRGIPARHITFLCRALPGHAGDTIAAAGYRVIWLAQGIDDEALDAAASCQAWTNFSQAKMDLLVVDNYRLGREYCRAMRRCSRYLMVIDDLADRDHDCDLLLDQNLLPGFRQRYLNRVPTSTQLLLGPEYLLLRPEFDQCQTLPRDSILVSFGGGDTLALSCLAARAFQRLNPPDLTLNVVVGGAAGLDIGNAKQVFAPDPRIVWHHNCRNMAQLMSRAVMAVGAGGTSHWERLSMALPALVTVVADNQKQTTELLARQGMCVSLGGVESVSEAALADAMGALLADRASREAMAERAKAMMPARPGRDRVAGAMMSLLGG
ncbi:UDP-2,4-diacetamido-2,4,6-trideoxy-beta-L-altropyranose hydrolase [Shewanella sp. NFH-SH190041]|uniref:UDP-2,4-diacetamido-2,4, 6-trideoxy-beta-L-altropyranose hydrolase n=1 Tax=Shewanella sp. NFH-SH190041 TaxID=2950245 RepID=UPI0021C299EB|nr:UDP-2,4-diacetamido-2,4,6-trideoxy-beta-L-altropyranose hydrolase [Shewanella sp. NFH-SH190041]BDM63730.1 UDP-2,4-diacetamido-2,4,6-trideoxy-beta-L-altropyranose hydrolase [Shewanella sp. NFH-SH190041]